MIFNWIFRNFNVISYKRKEIAELREIVRKVNAVFKYKQSQEAYFELLLKEKLLNSEEDDEAIVCKAYMEKSGKSYLVYIGPVPELKSGYAEALNIPLNDLGKYVHEKFLFKNGQLKSKKKATDFKNINMGLNNFLNNLILSFILGSIL